MSIMMNSEKAICYNKKCYSWLGNNSCRNQRSICSLRKAKDSDTCFNNECAWLKNAYGGQKYCSNDNIKHTANDCHVWEGE
jgi:hypothetical protein